MAAPRFNPTRRPLPEHVRRRLEVATAMAWEAVVETHVVNARQFVQLLAGRMEMEDALARYLREMDLSATIWQAVNTRVLVALEDEEQREPPTALPLPESAAEQGDGWRRFRPDLMVRGVIEKQRRSDEAERWVELLLARAEEGLILTHVDNAITFAALLEGTVPYARAISYYLDAVSLVGGRAQAVFQRTMARLADAHLPTPAPRPPQPAESEIIA
jgi:hypothetical protein